MHIDRRVFFDRIREAPFDGALTQSQVDGMNALLDAFDDHDFPVAFNAYMLATAFHETARTMQPIKEFGSKAYFTRMYDIKGSRPSVARDLGNTEQGDGARYCGRGYVQLTGRRNYQRAGAAIGHPLEASPDLALDADIAAEVMLQGMKWGWFTTKKMADYLSKSPPDYVGARRIVNGTDRAKTIAGYAEAFAAALRAAHDAYAPPPPDIPTPKPKPSAQPASGGLFSVLARIVIAIIKAIFGRNPK